MWEDLEWFETTVAGWLDTVPTSLNSCDGTGGATVSNDVDGDNSADDDKSDE